MDDDSTRVDLICDAIGEQIISVLTSDAFREWLGQEHPRAGDLLILNNSFLHRDGIASRSKSIKYLCVAVEPDGQPSRDISVVISKNRVLSRFKRISSGKTGDYPGQPLRDSVEQELADLGTIVFAIAGRVGDDLPISVSFPEGRE
jgi:hypothetical protein